MKTFLISLATMLSLTGCMSASQQTLNQEQINRAIAFNNSIPVPTCHSDLECKDMMAAAQIWMTQFLGMKLEVITDTVVITHNSINNTSAGQVMKHPLGAGDYEFSVSIICGQYGWASFNPITRCNAYELEGNLKQAIWKVASKDDRPPVIAIETVRLQEQKKVLTETERRHTFAANMQTELDSKGLLVFVSLKEGSDKVLEFKNKTSGSPFRCQTLTPESIKRFRSYGFESVECYDQHTTPKVYDLR